MQRQTKKIKRGGWVVIIDNDPQAENKVTEIIQKINNSDKPTVIPEKAFDNCWILKEIEIPSYVQKISRYAFASNASLEKIEMPKNLTFIGDGTFYNCPGLPKIKIPNNVQYIGYLAFFSCKNLTQITIPSSVTSIGHRAFENCSSLNSIEIPSSVISIGLNVFLGCNSLEKINIPIPKNVSKNDCINFFTLISNLNDLKGQTTHIYLKINDKETIPFENNTIQVCNINAANNVVNFISWLFQNCKNLTQFTIPKGVNKINDMAFNNCRKLSQVSIPSSVTSIGDGVFSSCSSLTSLCIPNSVTSIGNINLKYCENIEIIEIPKHLFRNGENLTFDEDQNVFIMVENNSQKESIHNKISEARRRSAETNTPSQDKKPQDKSCIIC